VVAASGCATKGYVSKRISPVQKKADQTSAVVAKQQNEISYLNERVATTDNRLASVATTAQQANETAGQALQQGQANSASIQNNSSTIESHSSQLETHSTELEKLGGQFNYSLVETANVTFAVNKSDLTSEGKAALDAIIQKAQATPRSMIEVVGFTDDTGPRSFNLTLSRRRAQSVARYLVSNNVSLKSISLIGMGKEQTPQMLAADFEAFNPNASKREIRALARRVRVRLYAPGGSSTVSSSGGDSSGGDASADSASLQK
jgi:outer membrane protein OmpA-like peptidoglycan-associated protein